MTGSRLSMIDSDRGANRSREQVQLHREEEDEHDAEGERRRSNGRRHADRAAGRRPTPAGRRNRRDHEGTGEGDELGDDDELERDRQALADRVGDGRRDRYDSPRSPCTASHQPVAVAHEQRTVEPELLAQLGHVLGRWRTARRSAAGRDRREQVDEQEGAEASPASSVTSRRRRRPPMVLSTAPCPSCQAGSATSRVDPERVGGERQPELLGRAGRAVGERPRVHAVHVASSPWRAPPR